MFLTGHFDTYSNFALIVNEKIITWGKQLLGVFLFWIPRAVWPTKPVGSGHHLANELNLIYSNISCNYFAEGYINFGYIGIFLFILILALITAKMDKAYWIMGLNLEKNLFHIIYYVMLGFSFFIMRGDLMSSFAYLVGSVFAILITYKIGNIKIKIVV